MIGVSEEKDMGRMVYDVSRTEVVAQQATIRPFRHTFSLLRQFDNLKSAGFSIKHDEAQNVTSACAMRRVGLICQSPMGVSWRKKCGACSASPRKGHQSHTFRGQRTGILRHSTTTFEAS